MWQEALTLPHVLDGLLCGRVAGACDVLTQRLKSLERTARGTHWSVGRQMELVRAEPSSMADETETLDALRKAREEDKLRGLTGKGSSAKGGDSTFTPKGKKGREGKGSQKGKAEDGGKNRGGDGKRDDKGGWQGQKK